MEAIPYEERVRRAEKIPALGQSGVMSGLEVFQKAEVRNCVGAPEQRPTELKAAVFNMEHGCRADEITAFLRECPDLQDADILFADELDDGTERSGNRNNAELLAENLGMNYAYGLEFIELKNCRDRKGYEGNAIFSRWPIMRAEAVRLPEAYNWYFSEQKRIGGRVCVLAELDILGKRIGVVSLHLENRCDSAGRESQFRTALARAEAYFGDIPILVGGDCNTYACNAVTREEPKILYGLYRQGIPIRKAEDGEDLFRTAEAYGYDYRSFNGTGLETCRLQLPDGCFPLHIDWIFGKHMTCKSHGVVSTVSCDCTWAAPDSPIRTGGAEQLSDHNAVYCVAEL